MDRFIRITGCHMCPWNRSKLLHVKDAVLRTECGISPAENGGFKDCPPLKITSVPQPIPDWCPLELAPQQIKI